MHPHKHKNKQNRNLLLKKSADKEEEIRRHQLSSPTATSSFPVIQALPSTFMAVAGARVVAVVAAVAVALAVVVAVAVAVVVTVVVRVVVLLLLVVVVVRLVAVAVVVAVAVALARARARAVAVAVVVRLTSQLAQGEVWRGAVVLTLLVLLILRLSAFAGCWRCALARESVEILGRWQLQVGVGTSLRQATDALAHAGCRGPG